MMFPNIRSKTIYEAVVQKQRAAEENKQILSRESHKFFKDSELKAAREKQWTSERSFNNSMIAYLQPNKEMIMENLDQRRNKLSNLLQCENEFYERSLATKTDRSNQSMHNMREEYDPFMEKRDLEHYETQYQEPGSSLITASGAIGYREDRKREISEDEQNKKYFLSLQQQMADLKQLEEEAEELNAQREKIIMEQARLSDLETERQEAASNRKEQNSGKAILRQHTALLKRRSKQIQENLAYDIDWLARFSQLKDSDRVTNAINCDSLQSEYVKMRLVIEEDLRNEQMREAEIDNIYGHEAADFWKKRDRQWHHEQETRDRLISQILETRKKQLEEELYQVRQLQAMKLAERECKLKEVDASLENEEAQQNKVETQRSNTLDQNHLQTNKESKTPTGRNTDQNSEDSYEKALRSKTDELLLHDDPVKLNESIGYRGRPFLNQRRRTYLW